MKYNFLIISIVFIISFESCSFQPNNAEGITLFKIANDTLELGILDSYYVIKHYTVKEKEDTLYININSIYSPREYLGVVLIPVKLNIKTVVLQNDEILDYDSIPWGGRPIKKRRK